MHAVTLIGVPWDASSTSQRGASEAPPLIRRALRADSSNTWNERGDDLAAEGVLADAGDLELADDAARARDAITERVTAIVQAGRRPLVLGGDHSITYPVLRAFTPSTRANDGSLRAGGRSDALTILHFDAHADLYDEYPLGASASGQAADRFSHASPFARVMEERLAHRLVQIGIRTLNAHQRAQATRFGVEILGADRWREAIPLVGRLRGPVYVSVDLDVLEPMLAPGIAHPEPGGLTPRDVLDVLSAIKVPVIGADVVEYNPHNDVRDLTARVAAKFVKELVGIMRR